MQNSESGVSEIISAILAIILVIALAAIIGAIFLGWAVPLPKTAYIVTDATPVNITGASVVQLFMSQGETVSLAPATTSGLPVRFSLTNGSATYNFVPLPGTASQGWKPGTSIVLFRNTSGSWVADSTASVQNIIGFSNGTWTINIIDANSKALIAQHTVTLTGGGAPAPVSPPVANFIGTPLTGNVPLKVQFIDTSTGGTPTAWSWNFGDVNTSTLQSSNNTYGTAGTYTVSLKATNGAGNNTQVKTGYVIATQPGFTVWAWVKWINKPVIPSPVPTNLDNQTYATIVLGGSSNLNRQYHLQHDQYDTKFEFDITTVKAAAALGQGVHVWSTTNPNNGTWYLVTGVYDQAAGKIAIYVNGTQEGSWGSADSSGLRAYSGGQQIGGPSGICYAGSIPCTSKARILNGSVSGVQTFDYVKSQAEIQTHYITTHP